MKKSPCKSQKRTRFSALTDSFESKCATPKQEIHGLQSPILLPHWCSATHAAAPRVLVCHWEAGGRRVQNEFCYWWWGCSLISWSGHCGCWEFCPTSQRYSGCGWFGGKLVRNKLFWKQNKFLKNRSVSTPSCGSNLWGQPARRRAHSTIVSSQKIGAFSEPDRFWKPVGFFPELLSIYLFCLLNIDRDDCIFSKNRGKTWRVSKT